MLETKFGDIHYNNSSHCHVLLYKLVEIFRTLIPFSFQFSPVFVCCKIMGSFELIFPWIILFFNITHRKFKQEHWYVTRKFISCLCFLSIPPIYLWFSDVFRDHTKRPRAWSGLMNRGYILNWSPSKVPKRANLRGLFKLHKII